MNCPGKQVPQFTTVVGVQTFPERFDPSKIVPFCPRRLGRNETILERLKCPRKGLNRVKFKKSPLTHLHAPRQTRRFNGSWGVFSTFSLRNLPAKRVGPDKETKSE